jgi:hypothetical protein
MEENKNIELDEIMTREMDIFNSSWSILNNNCKVLEQYSEFIQKYLDTINTYYMSLTELNATFPSLLSDFSNIKFETIIKNIGQIVTSSIQIQLNHLLIFLSQSQSLIHLLNQSITQSKSFINKSKEINENIFSNIKAMNNNYHKDYLSMINSFENLENKLVENYVKKNYNKKDEINEDDENSLKNCIMISKKLENDLINFNKDGIRDYIKEYNKNIKDIKYNRDILTKNYYECILSIINNLCEYFSNLINEIHNEIDMDNQLINENSENEDIFEFQITEKETNSIIFKLFNSKKYNIKIIDNLIINYGKSKIENEDAKLRDSIFLLSEEDIYNIVKEIYNYDFISINKSEYDLEIEKEKLKILDLTKKLLSYELDRPEIITDEEVKILYNMINNNDEYTLCFLSVLNQFRGKSIYEMPKRVFDIIINIFQNSLNSLEKSKNMKIGEVIITLSFSFFKIEDKQRYYFGDIIKNNKILKSPQFWNDYIVNQIDKDLKRINLDIKQKKLNETDNKNIYDIILSKVLPSADTMSKFGIEKNEILNVIEPLINQNIVNKKSKESLLSLAKTQI